MRKICIVLLSLLLLCNGGEIIRIFAEDEEQPQQQEEENENEEENDVIKYVMVTDDYVNVRTGPSTEYAIYQIDGINQSYVKNQTYLYLDEAKDKDDNLWYKVKFNDEACWVFSEYVELREYQFDNDYDFDEELNNFPESYREKLTELHNQHPNWIFKAYYTDIEWSAMISAETVLGRSLIQGSNLDYRSKQSGAYNSETGQYIPLDGSSWFQAHPDVVSYYVDPRNFLNESDIFMFLKLTYSESETADAVQLVLDGSFMQSTDSLEGKYYHDLFVSAGQQANVSAIYLSTLALQEQGRSGTASITGTAFTLDGVSYSGLYNFFNIGATAGADNWKKGLRYASTTNEKYNLPWTSPEKAITGGAKWIASGYIDSGQDTLYFQKFNSFNGVYWHQYQTNIMAAYSESHIIYKAYRDSNAIDEIITFTIPVYLNMPTSTSLPGSQSETPENPAEEPVEEPEEETGFIEALSLSLQENMISGFNYPCTTEELKTQIAQIDSTLIVEFYENEELLSEDKTICSGLVLKVKDAEENENTYILVVKGDVNGDGKISSLDYVVIKNYIMNSSTLTDSTKLHAADYNGDGKISSLDYVKVKNCIMSAGD